MNHTRSLPCLCLGLLLSACGGGDGDISRTNATNRTNAAAESLSSVPYKGVSLAGAEFGVDTNGNGALPGTFGVDYIYPDPAYASGYASPDYFLAKGMTTFRLPFRWERLQPVQNAAFSAAELTRLTTTVGDLTAKGATVLLDPHNYARYGTSIIGSPGAPNASYADFWSRLAGAFKGNARVVFGLMNEPHDMPTEQWAGAANAAIAAIRATGAQNLVLVPGNGWDGGGGWTQSWYGTPNATAMLSIQDPANNFAFEVHQYLDANSAGVSPTCVSATVGSASMQGFTSWLRANGRRGFLGEFGASSDPTCLAAIDDLVSHVEANADVYLGWTYWAAGPWWGSNWMVLEPSGGVDVPQMATLLPHLSAKVSAPSCQPVSYDAATMVHSTGGAMAGGWNIWSDGYISTNHTVTAGQTTVTVTAGGSSAAGVWPHMVVSVDGAPIGNVSVSSSSWTDYAFPLTAPLGTHEIRVTYDNDYCSTTEDRNLYVAKVVVGCGAGAAPAPTCSDGIQNGNETGVDCGGSCPACPAPACQPATFAAGSMTASVGAAIQGGWNLWSNGDLSASAAFTAGPTTLTVNAEGSVAAGVWPHMVVSVGGVPIGSASVQSPTWTAYPFTFTATAGTQEIQVAFDNDYCSTTEDRNLYVESVVVGCGTGGTAGACVPTTCAATGKTCGSTPDGCGGTLQCGSCALPQTCGGAGVANVCGAPPANPPPPSSGGTIRIMPLGDSITVGVNGGYRDGLWTRLVGAGRTIDFVGSQYDQYTVAPDKDNEGHPGFTIGNIAASVDGWLASYTPDYVLLMIGTNDVAWWCAQTGAQVADTNALLIDQILADLPGSWVVVASIPPLSSSIIQPNNVDRAQLGQDYNAALQQRVATRVAAGKRVRFADVYSVLSVSDLYDGVHPTQAAADKVAQVWFDALTPILP